VGGTICEISGNGAGGGTATAHLVELDGLTSGVRSNLQARAVPLRQTAQYKSWFVPSGALLHQGHPVLAQIFFPFDDTDIDGMSDRVVLDALIQSLRYDLGQHSRVELEFVGHADPRGAATYNEALARRRAQKVRDYVQKGVERRGKLPVPYFLYYRSIVTSLGEQFSTGDDKADRRVDVVWRSVTRKEIVRFPPTLITAEYKGPLTRKLQFKGWDSASVGGFKVFALDLVEMEIRNPRTGASAFYQYTGASVGTPSLPVSIGIRDTDYTDLELPAGHGWVDVEDFAGGGAIQNATSVAKTGAIVTFFGPTFRFQDRERQNNVDVFMDGWSTQLVPSVSSGMGQWVRLPYNTAFERERYLAAEAEKQRQRRSDRFGSKH
jgi:outer membrane protein OmpA-like peptidoglycan-associated protein